ncbi:FHA domain-containing protein At4g14490-like [Phoenix dactylifera]|uniref:FHA domain-containing protein At4g14490-like n=1 Tax=Phoenix dactylifera TaxID=42345 RepID=A0A8B7CXM2_PHODC|nr:FHA domain-containing protein At4g14490-like [Phoenix dactylifera]
MENPILRLVVENGPKEGEMLECKPGARTRIGRVVKGNTFAIRDPGVSQKHLAFEFLRETSRWVVSDLDTSNGTIVNDANIRPSIPFPLSDGDSIKIGETTSISVRIAGEEPHIDAAAAEGEERTGVRRQGRRRGAPPARPGAERPSDATVDVGSEALAINGGRARGRSRKTAASATVPKKDDILDAVLEEESAEALKNAGKGRGRRRPAMRAASARVSKEEEEDEEVRPLGLVPVSNLESVEAAAKGDILRLEASKSCEALKLAESGAGEVRQEEGEENMDKMTLGDWFDRMEKSSPLMINDISEEIISSLRDKAWRFDDFVAQSVHAG